MGSPIFIWAFWKQLRCVCLRRPNLLSLSLSLCVSLFLCEIQLRHQLRRCGRGGSDEEASEQEGRRSRTLSRSSLRFFSLRSWMQFSLGLFARSGESVSATELIFLGFSSLRIQNSPVSPPSRPCAGFLHLWCYLWGMFPSRTSIDEQ